MSQTSGEQPANTSNTPGRGATAEKPASSERRLELESVPYRYRGTETHDDEPTRVTFASELEATSEATGPAPPPEFRLGRSRYTLRERIAGAGELGSEGVFEALETNSDGRRAPVAVKFYRRKSAEVVSVEDRRVVDEARFTWLLARQCRFINPMIDYGPVEPIADHATGDDRGPTVLWYALVMELWSRRTLRDYLDGPLPQREVARLAWQALTALVTLHEQRIAHRDIKPSNFLCLMEADGQLRIRLIDLGIAKIAASEDGQRDRRGPLDTRQGLEPGTWAYLSPEAPAQPLTLPRDMFALGSVLWECLLGERPFSGPYYAMSGVPAQPLRDAWASKARPAEHRDTEELDPALEELVDGLLAPLPADRPAATDALELAGRALEDLAGPVTVEITADPLENEPTDEATESRQQAWWWAADAAGGDDEVAAADPGELTFACSVDAERSGRAEDARRAPCTHGRADYLWFLGALLSTGILVGAFLFGVVGV